jgi:hypothetical protein
MVVLKPRLVAACGDFVLEGWLVMTKLSQAVIACISAMTMSAGVASSAHASTFTYLLDNNTFADANGGPSLVSLGGTLNNGYTFGVQQGLSRVERVHSTPIR